MEERKKKIFDVLGVVAVGEASGISYQTISKFTKTGRVRSARIEKEIVKGAAELTMQRIQELSDTLDELTAWAKELR